MTKRRKLHEESQRCQQSEDDFIPLPIQTFLWRQTNPFVRPLLGKARDLAQIEQRDACKLFERIIITNNVWGQSPSLTDAIASIDRWRLIKVSFPFVLQCTASLMNNKLIKDNNLNRLGGNESKMMYTLQWILMNASEECADSENEAKNAISAASQLLKPGGVVGTVSHHGHHNQQQMASQGSTSSCTSGGYDVPSTNQQQHQVALVAIQPKATALGASAAAVIKATTAAAVQTQAALQGNQTGAPLMSSQTAQPSGHQQATTSSTKASKYDTSSATAGPTIMSIQQSIMLPAASAAASAVAVAMPAGLTKSLQTQTTLPSSSSASLIGSSTPTKPLMPTNATGTVATKCNASQYLLPVSSIQMFVYHFAPIMDSLKESDFLSANQRLEIGATLWEPLFNHQLPNVQCLMAQIKPPSVDELAAPGFFPRQPPSVGATPATTSGAAPIATTTSTVAPAPSAFFSSSDAHKQAEHLRQQHHYHEGDRRRSSFAVLDHSCQFGDVFLGGPSSGSPSYKTGPAGAALTAAAAPSSKGHRGGLAGGIESPTVWLQPTQLDRATYLDVAVLRCLFVTDWHESGVFWSLQYLSNRLEQFDFSDEISNLASMRPLSRSLPSIGTTDLGSLLAGLRGLSAKKNKNKQQKKIKANNSRQPTGKSALRGRQASRLRVSDRQEEAEAARGDSTRQQLSPRRLSFSTSMQTLANQIRKTSKRTKKSSAEYQSDNDDDALSRQERGQAGTQPPPPQQQQPASGYFRRSSSADDLGSSQLLDLTRIHKAQLGDRSAHQLAADPQQHQPIVTVSVQQDQPDARTARAQNGSVPSGDIYGVDQDKPTPIKSACNQLEFQGNALVQSIYYNSLRRLDRLVRSQTVPDGMRYATFETGKAPTDQTEASEASQYIDERGRLDPLLLLKALHSISQREGACSQRVCDKVLALMLKLIDIGILRQEFNNRSRQTSAASSFASGRDRELIKLLPSRQQGEFLMLISCCSGKQQQQQQHGPRNYMLFDECDQKLDKQLREEAKLRTHLVHKILMDIVFRIYNHLGCPNHCGLDSTVNQHHRQQASAPGHRSKLASFNGKSSLAATRDATLSEQNLRASLRETLVFLQAFNNKNFTSFTQSLVSDRSLQSSIDVFHSVLGFCSPDYLNSLKTISTSSSSFQQHQLNQIPSSVSRLNLCTASESKQQVRSNVRQRSVGSQSSCNSEESAAMATGSKTPGCNQQQQPQHQQQLAAPLVESIIVQISFKKLISRMASSTAELKLLENTSLYCDIRRLIGFVRENYSSLFRGIVLSALIECTQIINKQQRALAEGMPRESTTSPPSDDESTSMGQSSARCGRLSAGAGDLPMDDSQAEQTFHGNDLSVDESSSSNEHKQFARQQHYTKRKGASTEPAAMADSTVAAGHQQQQQQGSGILSLSKARKKLEQVFGGSANGTGSAQSNSQQTIKTGNKGRVSANDTSATDNASRRTSIVGNQSMGSLPPDGIARQRGSRANNAEMALLSPSIMSSSNLLRRSQQLYEAVHTGMLNYSFLMQSCSPGEILDPALLAALLDLKSPIAIRAAIFFECANLVHRCNRGQWPSWMKMNQQVVAIHRNSTVGLVPGTSLHGKNRKSSSIQRTTRSNTLLYRAAGKAFYSWAEAVGTRLEELMQAEMGLNQAGLPTDDGIFIDDHQATSSSNQQHEFKDSQSNLNGTEPSASTSVAEVDFFQSTYDNSSCPFALKMAACQLLLEVTTFLRETYRYLPPSVVHQHQATTSKLGDKMSSIYDVSRAVTANRRWSMALSSLGFGQLPATLSALSSCPSGGAGNVATGGGPSGNQLRQPSIAPEHESRRISFILHETPDENDRSTDNSAPDHESQQLEGGRTVSISSDQQQSMQHQDGIRKLNTSGRHLSQSNASSAVVVAAATCLLRSSGIIDTQTHRRKSIKLKRPDRDQKAGERGKAVLGKTSNSQQQQELEEENENSSISETTGVIKRTDSLRSRRRVSGISEKSDASTVFGGTNAVPAVSTGQQQTKQDAQKTAEPAASGDESAGNGSGDDMYTVESAERHEADESRIMSNMSWFKAIALINASIECDCSHFPSCKLNCYKSRQSMCRKLINSVQSIYRSQSELEEESEESQLMAIFESKIASLLQQRASAASHELSATKHSTGHKGSAGRVGLNRTSSDCSTANLAVTTEQTATSVAAMTATTTTIQASGATGVQLTTTMGPPTMSQQEFLTTKKKDKKAKRLLADSSQSDFTLGSEQLQSKTSGLKGYNVKALGEGAKLAGAKLASKLQQQQYQQQLDLANGAGLTVLLSDVLKSYNAAMLARSKQAYQDAISSQATKALLEDQQPQIVRYLKLSVKNLLHCPMSAFLKGAVILPRDSFVEMLRFSWNLLLEDDQQLSRTAAVCFIISSIKCPAEATKLLLDELASPDAARKIAAVNKFQVVWDARYQCWPRLEDGAFVHFKMTPPSIEFTLPSPKIAHESRSVVDPPWMPRKTSNVEEVTIGQDQTVQKSFVTATKTRRKQQIEIVARALKEKHDKLREGRKDYHITSVPITLYAAYEPALGASQAGGDELDGGAGASGGGTGGVSGGGGGTTNSDEDNQQENRALIQMKAVQALFPTCLCQAAIVMINLLEDSRVSYEGSAVYEVASKVIWSCLVEDPSLFLRYFFERLTRQNQNTIFQVLRRLIRFMPRLPSQAAYTLYNYLVGFIIYYIRCPVSNSQKLIADTMSVLCLVVPSVYGLFLKDLKQIFRKEQCDHSLLITANVPSAKKIIVHGSDSSGIPSQFPIDETTQFYHILIDSLEFFGIEKDKQNEYFLVDVRTNHMHSLHSYVRDYYSFRRSQHPQLQLIQMDPDKAYHIMQKQEFIDQFLAVGKVLMTFTIIKSSDMAVQRALFLHEELMKLPTFPRRALETNFSLFQGQLGNQVFSMDRIHKISWVKVISRMFEPTSGFFLQLGEIHLFLNAVSGVFVLHCEEASVARLCLATFINAAYQFKNIFATDGFTPIMATIVQVYSNHQSNQLLCRSIEFVCKQFYIMHRKPFLLQLFGSVAPRLNSLDLDQSTGGQLSASGQPLSARRSSLAGLANQGSPGSADADRISPTAFFKLLQSLEKAFKDPLDILELVEAEKPLRAVDFCYQQDKEVIEILDIISLCVTVTAYASDSPRSTQMLIILEAVVPLYMKYLQNCTAKKAGQSMGKQAHKDELQKIQSISICIRTLLVNCEGLTRNFNGPLPLIDFRSSSIRKVTRAGQSRAGAGNSGGPNNSSGSPNDLFEDVSQSGYERTRASTSFHSRPTTGSGVGGTNIGNTGPNVGIGGGLGTGGLMSGNSGRFRSGRNFGNSNESEISRGIFIVPRDTLLNLVAEFLSLSTVRLVESAKKYVDLHQKHSSYELLDVKSHLRLAEVANSLVKFASTDPSVMGYRGLIRYMNEILPNTEWRQEAIRPALIMILKRLDKTFNRIAKKSSVKRSTDWEAAKQLLKGAYLTFIKHPYIVHLPHLKSLISCCQNIILSDSLRANQPPSLLPANSSFFHSPQAPSGVTSSQSATMMQQAAQISALDSSRTGQTNYLNVGNAAPGATLSPSGSSSGGLQNNSTGNNSTGAPVSAPISSFAATATAAALAERLAASHTNVSVSSATSQAFNSVTIRLIAMQLLQTGDNQTLENLIGNSMNTPEKLEAVMLNLIYPMCIRVCSGSREAPKLRACDVMFILNVVLQMFAPYSSSSKSGALNLNSPKTASDTSQFILSKITTTISGTQTGATALGIVGSATHSNINTHQIVQHPEALKIGFLGLKILCVCFESQLSSEWVRISRVIRDLTLQPGQPSGPLWDFLDFVATYRFPMFILLTPMIKCHLSRKVLAERNSLMATSGGDPQAGQHNMQCKRLIDARMRGLAWTVCRSKSFLFVSLTAELRMLKEHLVAKRRLISDGERAAASGGQSHSAGQAVGGGLSGSHSGASTAGGQAGAGSSAGGAGQQDHFATYHRLSAALAMFANQGGQQQMGAALKGASQFAAQLASPSPMETAGSSAAISKQISGDNQQVASPPSTSADQQLRRESLSASTTGTKSSQIIMDPAMLMAAFLPPRKSTEESSGILKQLIQTIDRQNLKQSQHKTTSLSASSSSSVNVNTSKPTTGAGPGPGAGAF